MELIKSDCDGTLKNMKVCLAYWYKLRHKSWTAYIYTYVYWK